MPIQKQKVPLLSQPGINRDLSYLDTTQYIDGLNVGFYNGKPQKLKGYKELPLDSDSIISGMYIEQIPFKSYSALGLPTQINQGESYARLIFGSEKHLSSALLRIYFVDGEYRIDLAKDKDGNSISVKDMMPASNYIDNVTGSQWSFDTIMVNTSSTLVPEYSLYIVAHICYQPWCYWDENVDIGNSDERQPSVFYIPFIPSTTANRDKFLPMSRQGFKNYVEPGVEDFLSPSGGIISIGEYLVTFGSNGLIEWSNANNLFVFQNNTAKIASGESKELIIDAEDFIAGMPIRSGSQLTALLWSRKKLVAISEISGGGFDASYVATDISCISSRSVAAYEPSFYWVGVDTFYVFNGSVSEVPNYTNKKFFFNNLNLQYSFKVTSFIKKTEGEWWILFPKGKNQTECNWALVFNIQGSFWYDTPYNRFGGIKASNIVPYPILASTKGNNGNYSLYLHDYGWDEIDRNQRVKAIPSYITSKINLDVPSMTLDKVVWDIKQDPVITTLQGREAFQYQPLDFSVFKLAYPAQMYYPIYNDIIYTGCDVSSYTIYPIDNFTTMRESATYMNLRITSNTIGGNYLFGSTNLYFEIENEDIEAPVINPQPQNSEGMIIS